MTWLLLNIPLMVLFFALWVGVPVWLVLQAPRPQARPGRGARRQDCAGGGAALPGGRRLPPGRLGELIRPVRAGDRVHRSPARCLSGGRT